MGNADGIQQHFASNTLTCCTTLGGVTAVHLPEVGIVLVDAKTLEKRLIVDKTELGGNAFGENTGMQQPVLRLVEFLVCDTRFPLDALEIRHLAGFARDLDRRGRGIFRRHQQGDHQAQDDACRNGTQYQVTPAQRDAQILADDGYRVARGSRGNDRRYARAQSGAYGIHRLRLTAR